MLIMFNNFVANVNCGLVNYSKNIFYIFTAQPNDRWMEAPEEKETC